MDKKKKILTLAAVVLVGGLAALSSTGGISNLRSSFWVDTGDGGGYWDYSDENTNIPENPPVIVDTNTQYKSPELIKLEQEYKDLELASIELQKKKDEANLALNGPNGSQTKINKLLGNLDLYACTKKAAYKDKGYKYASVSEVETKVKVLNSFITKDYPSTLARLNAELKKIPAKNTNDIQKKKTEIETLRKQKTAADEEKKAITDSTTACITPAKTQIAQLQKTMKSQIDSLDKAQKGFDENQKQKDENKKKQEGEKNKGGNNGGQGNQNGGDNTDKTSATFHCPPGTLNYATKGGIDAFTVSSYKQANATGGGIKWSVSYYEDSTNGEKTFGPLNSREEAIAKGEEIACGGYINTSSCYIDLAASIQAKSSMRHLYLCSESSFLECSTKCNSMKSGYLQSINDCKSNLDKILNPNQNWRALEGQIDRLVDMCWEDCKESNQKCVAKCGDNLIQEERGEECDDGNTNNIDGCSSTCKIEKCGDSVIQSENGEMCDDGNTTDGDGCNSSCQSE